MCKLIRATSRVLSMAQEVAYLNEVIEKNAEKPPEYVSVRVVRTMVVSDR